MNTEAIKNYIHKITTTPNKKLNSTTGSHAMNLIKQWEHTLVKELQLLGELKRAIRQEVYKNSGRMLEL